VRSDHSTSYLQCIDAMLQKKRGSWIITSSHFSVLSDECDVVDSWLSKEVKLNIATLTLSYKISRVMMN